MTDETPTTEVQPNADQPTQSTDADQAQAGPETQPVADGAAATEITEQVAAAPVEPEGAAPTPPAAAPVPDAKPAKKGKATVRTEVKKPVVNVVTAETTTKTEVQDTEVDELPSSVTLTAPYGFIDDAGERRFWGDATVVTDPDEIALLVERGAIFKAE